MGKTITKTVGTLEKNHCVDCYLREIYKNKPLFIEEETRLVEKAQKGDRRAFDKLVEANLKFVVMVAKKYQNQGVPLLDLINEGNIALVESVSTFDLTKGFKFITHAVRPIQTAILSALNEQKRTVYLPIKKNNLLFNTEKAIDFFESKYDRPPTSKEIAHHLGVRESDARFAEKHADGFDSLDSRLSCDGDSFSYLDIFYDDSHLDIEKSMLEESLIYDLTRYLKILKEKEREILKMYFGFVDGFEVSKDDIAKHFDLEYGTVITKIKIIIERLKSHPMRESLLKYLN